MKKYLLHFLFLFPTILFAQTADEAYKFGPAFNNTKGFSYPDMYIHPEHNTFSFANPSIVISVRILGDPLHQTIKIQRYDQKNLTELSNNQYTDFPKSAKVQGFSKTATALYLLYSTYAGGEFYVRQIDITTGVMGESKLLFNGPEMSYIYNHGEIVKSMFKISTSLDSSKVLISYTLKGKNSTIEAGYRVFSNSMEKIWEGVIKMPYTESMMTKFGSTVSNKGEVYQLILSKATKKFEILIIKSPTDVKIGKLEISTELDVFSGFINETKTGNFSCTGLYGMGYQNSIIQGMLRFQVDAAMKTVYSTKVVFDETFIKAIGPVKVNVDASKNIEVKNRGVLYLKLFQVTECADGTSLIITEQQNFVSFSSEDIVIIKIDKTGNVSWMVKIPRSIKAIEEWGEFYIDQESIYALFMDNPKNAASTEKPVSYSPVDQGDFVSYKINITTGAFSKQIVFSTKDQDVSAVNSIMDDLVAIGGRKFITTVLTKKGTQTRVLKLQVK